MAGDDPLFGLLNQDTRFVSCHFRDSNIKPHGNLAIANQASTSTDLHETPSMQLGLQYNPYGAPAPLNPAPPAYGSQYSPYQEGFIVTDQRWLVAILYLVC
jgi:hypothetical protein